jgi:UDP-glucose 4-epimerase
VNKCLVTGISGLIGSHLIHQLCEHYSIVGLSRKKLEFEPRSNKFEYLEIDLSKSWETMILPDKIDAVIHLAQSEHFRDFPDRAEDIFQVNTFTTLRLLDYARKAGAKTFILASSGGIYGHGDREFSEDLEISARGDLGFYLGTKLCSEAIAESYTPFMNIIVLRFFFVYGSGQRRSMLIPRLIQSVLNGKPIALQGQDGIRLNPTHVSDAVTAIIHSLQLEGSHKINVAGSQVLSLREIGEIIGKAVDKKPKFDVQMDVQPRHLVGDINKMSRLLGLPKVKFEEGIEMLMKEFNI